MKIIFFFLHRQLWLQSIIWRYSWWFYLSCWAEPCSSWLHGRPALHPPGLPPAWSCSTSQAERFEKEKHIQPIVLVYPKKNKISVHTKWLMNEQDLQYLATGVLRQPLVFRAVWSTPTRLLALRYLAWEMPNMKSSLQQNDALYISKEGCDMWTQAYMINSFGWQTVVATPPITTQGFSTVCPPVTDVPASSDASLNPWMIRGMTLSLSCTDPGNSEQRHEAQRKNKNKIVLYTLFPSKCAEEHLFIFMFY